MKKIRNFVFGIRSGSISPQNPPPYEEVCQHPINLQLAADQDQCDSLDLEVEEINRAVNDLDLISNCNNDTFAETPINAETSQQQNPIAYEPSYEMGGTTSMLTGRHRSKVSLTWVLRERDIRFNPCNGQTLTESLNPRKSPSDSYKKRCNKSNKYYERNVKRRECDYLAKKEEFGIHSDKLSHRIVGRNIEQNKPLATFSNNEQKVLKVNKSHNNLNRDSCSDYDKGSNYLNSTRKHRHRRRKKNGERHQKNFGYEIMDIDWFLAEASIENPGNIPVVVTYPSILYQTRSGNQQTELPLSLGMVVNAVFKNQQWLYVQTPHGEEGYILYASCLPLGILPPKQRSSESWKTTPCWESTWDLYPQPCGNMTDSDKEQLRGGTKSECGRSRSKKSFTDNMSVYSEKTFDKLYLRATSSCSKLKDINYDNNSLFNYSSTTKSMNDFNLKNTCSVKNLTSGSRGQRNKENMVSEGKVRYVSRHTLLIVEKDYQGSKAISTLSVSKGDVVILMEGCGTEADVDAEWFYIRNKDGEEGFIPASVAGHGYL